MTEQPTSPHGAADAPPGAAEKPHGAAEGLRDLRRSRDERMIAGVLGGLAQRLGVDPVLLRIVTVVLAIFGGVGIVIYAAGWLLIPDEGTDRSIAEQALGRSDDRPEPATLWLAGGLTLAVLFAVGATFGSGIGPVLLVLAAAGVIVLLRRDGDTPTNRFADRAADGEPAGPTSGDATGPVPDEMASGDADTVDGDTEAERLAAEAHSIEPPGDTTDAAVDDTGSAEPSDGAETGERPEYVHSFTTAPVSAWPDPPDWPASDAERIGFDVPEPSGATDKPASSHLGTMTLSAAAVALGILAIVDAAGAGIAASAYVALALAIIGVGLLIGTWFGRSRALIAWGLIGTLIVLPATAIGDFLDWELSGEDRTVTIDDVAELPEGPVSHSMGRVVYDLGALEPSDQEELTLDVSHNVGQLQIIVPPEVDVTVNASTGMGHIAAFGVDVGGHQDVTATDVGDDGAGGGTLTLNLDLGVGEILVERAEPSAADVGIEEGAR